MSKCLRLEVVTPEKKVFSDDVTEIQFPTAFQGYYGILPDHTPVLTPLGDGLLNCVRDGKKTVMTVFGGFSEVGPDYVTILARESETADSLDSGAISKQLQDARERIVDAKTPDEQRKIQALIDACKLRLQALE
jgi:F-type H+-transporting ATPase subunit epsilon